MVHCSCSRCHGAGAFNNVSRCNATFCCCQIFPALTEASTVCLQGGVLKKTVVDVQGPELVQAVTTLSDPATGGV